jgi:hypothetical protein
MRVSLWKTFGSNIKPVIISTVVYWCWTFSRPVSCPVICLFNILEVTTALVGLHMDVFLCLDDVRRVGYERNL